MNRKPHSNFKFRVFVKPGKDKNCGHFPQNVKVILRNPPFNKKKQSKLHIRLIRPVIESTCLGQIKVIITYIGIIIKRNIFDTTTN